MSCHLRPSAQWEMHLWCHVINVWTCLRENNNHRLQLAMIGWRIDKASRDGSGGSVCNWSAMACRRATCITRIIYCSYQITKIELPDKMKHMGQISPTICSLFRHRLCLGNQLSSAILKYILFQYNEFPYIGFRVSLYLSSVILYVSNHLDTIQITNGLHRMATTMYVN